MFDIGDGWRPCDPRISNENHRVVLVRRQALADIISLSLVECFLFGFIPNSNASLVLFIGLLFVLIREICFLFLRVYLSHFDYKVIRDSRY